MKLINYDGGDWLIDDEMAGVLIEYSVVMARQNSADSVQLNALTTEGAALQVNLVLGPATMMTSRSTDAPFDEPDNSAALAEVREHIDAIESPPSVLPAAPDESISEYEL